MSGFFTQTDLFLLHRLSFVKVRDDTCAVYVFFGVNLSSAIELDELLYAIVMGVDRISTLLDYVIFCLDLFQQMGNFSWEVGD